MVSAGRILRKIEDSDGTLDACKEIRRGLRGRRINAFRSRGFGHVRKYTPVALLRKAAFLRDSDGTLNACKEIWRGLRGRRINAFRLRGFGHVREYTPVALLHKAAFLRATSQASTARLPPRGRFREKTRYLGLSWLSEISRFFNITLSVFSELAVFAARFFCMGSFLCSYVYMKNRVRLMRTEEDGNENMGHFVSVGARLASLPRGEM